MILSPHAPVPSSRVDLSLTHDMPPMGDSSLRRRHRRRRSSATTEVDDGSNTKSLLKGRSSSEKSLKSLVKLHSRGENRSFPSPAVAGMIQRERDDRRSSRTHSTRRSSMNKSFSMRESTRSSLMNKSFSLRDANKRTTTVGALGSSIVGGSSTNRAAASAHSRRGDFSSRRSCRTAPWMMLLQEGTVTAADDDALAAITLSPTATTREVTVRRRNSRTGPSLLLPQQKQVTAAVTRSAAPIASAAIAAVAPEPSVRRRNSRTGASILMLQQENAVASAVSAADPLVAKKPKAILRKQSSETRRKRRTSGRASTRKQQLQVDKIEQQREQESGSSSPRARGSTRANTGKRLASKSANHGSSTRRLSASNPSSSKDPQRSLPIRRVASNPNDCTIENNSLDGGGKNKDSKVSRRRSLRKSMASTSIPKHSNETPSSMSASSTRRHSGHCQKSPVSIADPLSSLDKDIEDDGVEFHEDCLSTQKKLRTSGDTATLKESVSEVDVLKAAVATANLSRSQSLSAIKANTVLREDKPWEQKTIRQQIAAVQTQSQPNSTSTVVNRERSHSKTRRPKTPTSKGKAVVKITSDGVSTVHAKSNHKASPPSKSKAIVVADSLHYDVSLTDAPAPKRVDEGEQIVQAAATMAHVLDILLKGVNSTSPGTSKGSEKAEKQSTDNDAKAVKENQEKSVPPLIITTSRCSPKPSSKKRSASLSTRNKPMRTTACKTFHQRRSSLQGDEMETFASAKVNSQSDDQVPVVPNRGRSRALGTKNRGRARSFSISAPSSIDYEVVLPSVVGTSRWTSEQ